VYKRDATQVITFEPNGTDGRWLGSSGGVAALQYSYVLPGGPDQLQCQLQCEPNARIRALEPGRIVQAYRGVSKVWDGKMDMPTPSVSGWQVSAHGIGAPSAGEFMAYYATSYEPDDVVNQAISRGLRWSTPGNLNSTSGLYLSQPQDSASQSVASFLDAITQPGNLTWYVGRGNRISIFTPPSSPATCNLVTSLPVARSLAGYYNQLWLRYEISADGATSGNAATYGTTYYQDSAQVGQHGQLEIYQDLSAAGVLSAGAAQAVGQNQLARYQAASFTGTFDVGPGQLLNPGGVPIDLGIGMAGPMVAQILVANNSYGAEVTPTPPLLMLIGGYTFFDDTQSAQVSAFQYAANDLATLLSNWTTENTPAQTTSS
jgi:hypothetical protein